MKPTYYIPPKERYGLIALIFLLVTVHSVSLILSSRLQTKNDIHLTEKDGISLDNGDGMTNMRPVTLPESKSLPNGPLSGNDQFNKEANFSPAKSYRADEAKTSPGSNLSPQKFLASSENKESFERPDPNFTIDPNKADYEELAGIGLPAFVSTNIIKYREKGGIFKTPEDLLKIYGMDSILYDHVRRNIQMDSVKMYSPGKPSHKSGPGYSDKKLNINTASADQLIHLKGIGPVLSQRIVAYREKLGGYYNTDQLKEVYGLNDSTYFLIHPFLSVSGRLKKLFIPELSFKEVLRHPYIDYETTKLVKNISIIDFENDLTELIENKKIDPRLIPYLQISEPY